MCSWPLIQDDQPSWSIPVRKKRLTPDWQIDGMREGMKIRKEQVKRVKRGIQMCASQMVGKRNKTTHTSELPPSRVMKLSLATLVHVRNR